MNSTQMTEHTIKIYGVDHSPWVQGVLLACAYHQLPTQLVSYPLSFKHFWQNGLVFPAVLLKDGSIHTDSFKIYELLEHQGYNLGVQLMSPQERQSAQVELEKLFSIYALGRCMPSKRLRFIKAWSLMQERPKRWTGPIVRAFLSMYFWILIQVGIHVVRTHHGKPYRLDLIEKYVHQWDEKLRHTPWLSGENIGFLDFALWGHLQCMTSGLTDELIPLLQAQPYLIKWLQALSQLTLDLPTHYTERLINHGPQSSITYSRFTEQIIFWITLIVLLVLFPITLALIVLSLYKRYNNPARSGALISKAK